MSRGPLTALLAVLAIAGYQNRDKIAEMLKDLQTGQRNNSDGAASEIQGGPSDLFGRLPNGGPGGVLDDTFTGGILSEGLGGLLDQFRQSGLGERAESWVNTGPNKEVDEDELSQVLGDDLLIELTARTGLTREEILSRLSRDLPRAVDGMTPGGEMPKEEEFSASNVGEPSRTSVPNVSRQI